MKTLTLKKLKICRELSEETLAFNAEVYLDGVRVGEASERGNGGQVLFRASGPDARAAADEFNAQLKALPPRFDIRYGSLDLQDRSIEDAIAALADDMDRAKSIRAQISRLMKKNTVFVTLTRELMSINAQGPAIEARVLRENLGCTLLNTLSLDDAVAFCVKHL